MLKVCVQDGPEVVSVGQNAVPPTVSEAPPLSIRLPSPSSIVQEISPGQDPVSVQSSSIVSPVAASKVSDPELPPVMVAPSKAIAPLTIIFTVAPFHPSPYESAILNVCEHGGGGGQ